MRKNLYGKTDAIVQQIIESINNGDNSFLFIINRRWGKTYFYYQLTKAIGRSLFLKDNSFTTNSSRNEEKLLKQQKRWRNRYNLLKNSFYSINVTQALQFKRINHLLYQRNY